MRALLRNACISPQKARLAALLVGGLRVQEALERLEFMNSKACRILRKLLDSAVSNAENNHFADVDTLIVSLIRVDKGIVLKRNFCHARGKSGLVRKRRSNIEVRVGLEPDPGHSSKAPARRKKRAGRGEAG